MTNTSKINQEEFQTWLLNPVTKALMATLEASRERLKEAWANGEFKGDSALECEVRGQAAILGQLLALEFSDVQKEE